MFDSLFRRIQTRAVQYSFLTQRTSSLEAKCKLDNLPNLIQLSLRSIQFVDIICLISFVLVTKNAVNVFIISRFLTRIYANSINVNRVKNFVSQFVSQFIRVLFWSCVCGNTQESFLNRGLQPSHHLYYHRLALTIKHRLLFTKEVLTYY